MDQYDHHDHHHHKKQKGGIGGKLLLAGIIIIILVVAIFAYYLTGGPVNISAPTVLKITNTGTVFAIAGKSYVATLEGYNSNINTAYVYVSSVPVFLGPVINVTLKQNNTVKVNYGGLYAIIQMTLLSYSGGVATIKIAPLSAALQIDPDYQYINHPTVQLPGLAVTVTTTVPQTAGSNSTNSVTQTTTIKATTTVAATTTVQAANGTKIAIQTALDNDPSYGLMLNYTAIYNSTSGCTSGVYGNSYFSQYGTLPSGPVDYTNMSYETPYGMVQKTVSKGGGVYDVEFLPLVHDPQFNGTVALNISLSIKPSGTSTLAVVNSNKFGGIFEGQSYSDLSSEYTQTKAVGNACAALVG